MAGAGKLDGAEGGKGGTPEIKENEWSFGDTTGVPIVKLDDFCRDYVLDNTTRTALRDYGIGTANGLFELQNDDLENLKKAGLKRGHIAELRRALKQLMAK
jgi:hypothetical protein